MTLAAVCFDATGTLIETTESVGAVYGRVAREFGVDLPAWRLEDAFRRILHRAPARSAAAASFDDRCRAETTWWFERIRETFQATDSTVRFSDFPAFADALFETYRSPDVWRLRPGTIELLTALQRAGLRMAVTSNFDHRLPKILEILDISPFFESVVIPAKIGRAKPDRAVFEAVLAGQSAPSKQLDALLYVGDDAKETLQAIADLGLEVIDVHDFEDPESLTDRVLKAAILPPQGSHTHPQSQD